MEVHVDHTRVGGLQARVQGVLDASVGLAAAPRAVQSGLSSARSSCDSLRSLHRGCLVCVSGRGRARHACSQRSARRQVLLQAQPLHTHRRRGGAAGPSGSLGPCALRPAALHLCSAAGGCCRARARAATSRTAAGRQRLCWGCGCVRSAGLLVEEQWVPLPPHLRRLQHTA